MNTETGTGVAKIRERRTPSIVKDAKGRERTENMKWSLRAMANHIANHPEKLHTAAELCRIANETASKVSVERRRRDLSRIADLMVDELHVPTILEWNNRKIVRIGRYNEQDEYHQHLMAQEITRRRMRRDGSDRRLEKLIGLLPRSVEEIQHE